MNKESKTAMEDLLYRMEQQRLSMDLLGTQEGKFLSRQVAASMARLVMACQNQYGVTLRPVQRDSLVPVETIQGPPPWTALSEPKE